MTSSWDFYYILFLSAILSLCIPASLAAISFIFFPKAERRPSVPQNLKGEKSNQTILGQRINIRFFLAVNAALILITLALELIPCATTVQSQNKEDLMKGLVSIITLAGFAVLGLLYSVKTGDMGWLSSFNTETSQQKKSD